ncbi:cuticle protein CP1158-like [Penaeus japonicus]|uniref:cuticle protein CP1158-like n=1 Tax=Penaeus japonicus TaxID=27405 RepID=UPI001C711052|nr:cuticle protein CP1158-like [Penaeus japonicus]
MVVEERHCPRTCRGPVGWAWSLRWRTQGGRKGINAEGVETRASGSFWHEERSNMKFLVLLAAVVACVSGASINAGWVLPAGNIGTSGILRKDGSTDLFSHDFAHRIVAIGPSGIILEDGSPVQLDADLNMVGRSKRSAGYVSKAGSIGFSRNQRPNTSSWTRARMVGRSKRHVVGDTGMITDWGQIIQFREPFTKIVSDGPSGIVLSDGQNIQKPAA